MNEIGSSSQKISLPTVEELHATIADGVRLTTGLRPEISFWYEGHPVWNTFSWHKNYRPANMISDGRGSTVFGNPSGFSTQITVSHATNVPTGTLFKCFSETMHKLGVPKSRSHAKHCLMHGYVMDLMRLLGKYAAVHGLSFRTIVDPLDIHPCCCRSECSFAIDLAFLHYPFANGRASPLKISVNELGQKQNCRFFISPFFSAAGIIVDNNFFIWSDRAEAFVSSALNNIIPKFGVCYVDSVDGISGNEMIMEYIQACKKAWRGVQDRVLLECADLDSAF